MKGGRRTHRRSHHKKRATHHKKRSAGLFAYVYKPVDETLGAVSNITTVTAKTLGKLAETGVSGVRKVGRNVTGRANRIVSGLIGKSRRKTMRKRKH